ncbi:DUF3373 family protein [Desulfotignum phosphitoxidans]|uniref:DUF3373 domain-containing protein n=1 Tax=Desulfotignum phosphitoxidans DSM 13687 TaxID=1286635 RepID=S0G1Z4_9BACT|nr:DUF3373 family protein [Desulfotignum phosphitoxidans]EMS80950.1 hypothetical protein Dpo_1c00800 [Desulfotignum phosphitoxidans DSM 13687]
MKKGVAVLFVLAFMAGFSVPGVHASDEVKMLKEQLETMNQNIQKLQEKILEIEKKNAEEIEEVEYLNDRMDKAELHTATDKLSLGIELRSRADTLHYSDMQAAPAALVNGFFTPYASGGFNNASLPQIQQRIQNMAMAGMIPPTDEFDADNDVIFTNKFHVNMHAKVNDQLSFSGRMAAYKVFGDSSGVKFNQGSLGDITMDGNTSSLPHGDTLRLERAYFVYNNYWDNIPVSFSLGRRPSTYGPPLEYANYSLEAGSPLGTIINWQFDGASLNFGLENVTGIYGAALKFCYGVGFEGDWGNSYSLEASQPDVDDVHMFGFIATLFDDDSTSAVLNYAHAWDITDGFTGLTVMPFTVAKDPTTGLYAFEQNTGGYISRMQPSTDIGDWDAASLLLRKNLYEMFEKDIDLFLALSWSHTSPSQVSANPFYEIMGQGLLNSNGNLEDHDGYSLYAGAIFPMPFNGRLGLEYNWGSKYWFNFTGAEDSLVGSKLATRGSVYEGYYIQPIFGQNFFVKLGARYYDYKYTGSGNPLGAPEKISELNALNALFPVADKVWDGYISATVRF